MKIIDYNTTGKSKSKILINKFLVAYINQGNSNFNQSYNSHSGKPLISSGIINKVK